jgi:hypothetical protein
MSGRRYRRPNGREIRQRGKHMKRPTTWHQGRSQAVRWEQACKRLDAQKSISRAPSLDA